MSFEYRGAVNTTPKTVRIQCYFKAETDKAYKIELKYPPEYIGKQLWIPKSQVVDEDTMSVTVNSWILAGKGVDKLLG